MAGAATCRAPALCPHCLIVNPEVERAVLSETLCQREPYLKPRLTGFRVHLNAAPVLLHDTLSRVEAQASAFAHSLGGKKRFEDMRLYLGGNSRSVIGDLNHHTIFLAIGSDSKLAL